MSLMMSASGFPCIERDFPSPIHFLKRRRGSKLSLIEELLVSYPVFFWRLPVLGMPLLIQLFGGVAFFASSQLAATTCVFVQFEVASSHYPLIIRSVCGIYCSWEVVDA